MAYGIFYAQCEITKKNGRLPSIEDAIKLAEQRFDECGQNICAIYHTLADAREELAKLKCELCPARFWSIGSGYNAYMYQIIELGTGDGYGFAEWTYPGTDEEEDKDHTADETLKAMKMAIIEDIEKYGE